MAKPGMTLDPIDEIVERCNEAREAWALLDGEARELEEMRKPLRAEVSNQERRSGLSATAADSQAEACREYKAHLMEMVEARTKANVKRAEVQGYELRWETWRTRNATRRAEMKIL